MPRHEFRALIVISLAAVVIRLAVSASFKGHSFSAADSAKPEPESAYLKGGEMRLGDSEQYLLLGDGIRHRLSFSWNHEPNTLRTPGYPLLLALVNNGIAAIVIIQALLAGLTVLLTGLVGSWRFSPRAGVLGAAMLAVDVPSIFYSGMVMSEVLFTFAVVLAAAMVWRNEWRRGTSSGSEEGTVKSAKHVWGEGPREIDEGLKDESGRMKADVLRGSGEARAGSPSRTLEWAAAGLVLGFAVLVRPVGLLVFVPFGVAPVMRRDWRGLAVLLAAFSLLPGAWALRNYHHYHRFGLASIGAYNLLYANAAALGADEMHVSWDSARVELARDFGSKLPTGNPLELSDALTRKATEIILHDPLRYAWVCLRGLPKIVVGIKSDDLVLRTLEAGVPASQASVIANPIVGRTGGRVASWLLAGFELVATIGAFLLALVSLLLRHRRAEKLQLVLVGIYFVVIALPLTDGRFRVPAMPFLYLAAVTVLAGSTGGTRRAAAGKVA